MVDAVGKSGLDLVVSVVIPFAFIMVLLWKAKEIATKMSGSAGQAITKGIAGAGAIALGGTALGGAFLGRKMIGQTIAKASKGENASQQYMNLKEREKMGAFRKAVGFVGSGFGTGKGINNIHDWTGKKLTAAQDKVGKVDHARHEWDEAAKAVHVVGKDGQPLSRNQMSKTQIDKVENQIRKSKQGEAEVAATKGVNAKNEIIELKTKDSSDKERTFTGADAFKSGMRKDISDRIIDDNGAGDVEDETKKVKTKTIKTNPLTGITEEVEEEKEVKTGKKILTRQGEEKLKDELNIKLSAAIKDASKIEVEKGLKHIKEEAETKIDPLTRAYSKANTGSYDIRDLSNMKTDRRESFGTKAIVGLTAAITMGMRAGIKSSGLSNGSVKVEGNFMKDLGNTISDSLKGMKINVDVSHVGESKSSADAHGGGHH